LDGAVQQQSDWRCYSSALYKECSAEGNRWNLDLQLRSVLVDEDNFHRRNARDAWFEGNEVSPGEKVLELKCATLRGNRSRLDQDSVAG